MTRPSARAAKFWRRLSQNYGARIADQYGPTMPEDWCAVIDRTDDERLEKALVKIRQDYLQFPPTLGQFEASIPKRKLQSGTDSVAEKLATHASRTLPLCEHQRLSPWTYFGAMVETDSGVKAESITGLTIPECKTRDCRRHGKPGYRVLLRDVA